VDGQFLFISFDVLMLHRIVESLFSSSASPTRKYWGFQVFLKALTHPHMSADKMCFLFTKNLMRCWINQLSGKDRLLNKAAQQVVRVFFFFFSFFHSFVLIVRCLQASSIPRLVQRNPTLGFTLILQLTGINGSERFDKLTRTKTVEFILAAMDAEGISNYIKWLLGQFDDGHDAA
jgi:DNA polymerase phi